MLKEPLHQLLGSKLASRMTAGGLAGVAGIVSTYPLDLVRARLAVQVPGQEQYRSVGHALRTIVAEDGVRGLFRGCGTACAERFPNMAVNFTVCTFVVLWFTCNACWHHQLITSRA